MPIIVANTGRDFEPAPAGLHAAVCCDVVDKGVVESTYSGKVKLRHVVQLRWLIDETNKDGRPFLVTKNYTASLNEKATLRHDLEAWRGRDFTDEELEGFDLESVLDKNCQLNIIHKRMPDKSIFAAVSAIVPAAKGQALSVPHDYVRVQDREQKPERADENGREPGEDRDEPVYEADV